MKEAEGPEQSGHAKSKHSHEPALQIICLASGGGPSEDSVTGFLVRSTALKWGRNSVLAVDAGSHLASITTLLESHFPRVADTRERNKEAHSWNASAPAADDAATETSSTTTSPTPESERTTTLDSGPFAGLAFPYESARANALWVVRECVSTYLITHPHLDHVSAFAINTAAFHNTTRPKRLAALPSTVNAIKAHIFNDIIWPNLTDEDGGVGFVTFQRLASGGNIAVGEGTGKGYIEVCDGLCVKGMKVSHGHCTRGPDAIPKRGSDVGLSEPTVLKGGVSTTASEGTDQRKMSGSHTHMPLARESASASAHDSGYRDVVVDSTAYFIRDDASGKEVLFFGDVEPDLLSLNPRTVQVWTEAAPKIASGQLKAVLIECSYDDSQNDNILFGHLCPRHLIRELQVLAEMVRVRRAEEVQRKSQHRKRKVRGGGLMVDGEVSTASTAANTDDEGALRGSKRRTMKDAFPPSLPGSAVQRVNLNGAENGGISPLSRAPTSSSVQGGTAPSTGPLAGLTVILIHIKDTLRDGPVVGERILRQLRAHDSHLKETDGVGLGCDFIISEKGGSYYF